MQRRGFLASILAAGMAPAVAKSGILMPVRKIAIPTPEPIWSEVVIYTGPSLAHELRNLETYGCRFVISNDPRLAKTILVKGDIRDLEARDSGDISKSLSAPVAFL